MAKDNTVRCRKLVKELIQLCAPGVIQLLLAREYKKMMNYSEMEAELEFWLKCERASQNLSSGMNKWAGDMIDAFESGEESETEGG